MPKFKVEWVKKLHIEGETVVEADSAYDAEVLVWRMDQDEWETVMKNSTMMRVKYSA